MDILVYLAALVIGLILGLLGGGGSILTIPVLVYMIGLNPVISTAYSLFIVGVASTVGAFNNIRKGLVSFKTAIVFAIPSFIAVYLTRLYLIPAIPQNLFSIGNFMITKDLVIMILFAVIMFLAAISMIRSNGKKTTTSSEPRAFNYPLIIIDGLIIGTLTGIVGAGGGFLIIPALVLLARLPMKLAVGTSLFIVAIKSLVGFLGDIQAGQLIEWNFLLLFTLFSVIGILLGGYLANFISNKHLKSSFGWFVLVMSIFIFGKEILF